MKKYFEILIGLFLSLFIPGIAFSQAGLTNSGMTQQQEMQYLKSQSGYGFDTGSKSSSALGQLENIAGQKVSSGNNDHHTVTPAQRPTNVANTVSQAVLFQNAVKMQLASGLASAFIGMLFSSNQKSPQQIEAERRAAAIAAARAEAERRYRDSIAQAKYEKMMESYKLLSTNMIKMKALASDAIGGIEFKPLDMKPAPMSREEIERQNLLRRGLKISWDNNAWAQVPANSYKMEETPVAESGPDQYLEQAINKIETFQGGRVAALAGRYVLNIKKETMSYLKDASDAAISGNIARMDEVGNVDLRARISSNALRTTGVQTAKAYAEQGKEFISGKINDAKDAANFALMEPKAMEVLKNNNIYSHVSDDWKVGLRKY